jgi:serine/threonine protein kinase
MKKEKKVNSADDGVEKMVETSSTAKTPSATTAASGFVRRRQKQHAKSNPNTNGFPFERYTHNGIQSENDPFSQTTSLKYSEQKEEEKENREEHVNDDFDEEEDQRKTTSIVLPDNPQCKCGWNGRNGYALWEIYKEQRPDDFDQLYGSNNDADDHNRDSAASLLLLGEGQFGRVYKRYHRILHFPVAVKETKPTVLDTKNNLLTIQTYHDVLYFCQEVRTLQKLRSDQSKQQQHVLQMYEFFWDPQQYVLEIVTEKLTNNLREWMNQQSMFTENQACLMAHSILSGIAYMHSQNIVHRDIKEENCMFARPDDLTSLKIVDFGFAKELTEREPKVRDVCGSRGYLAPEIYAKEPYGVAVDMFSFGVLLFRVLSSEKPWPADPSNITKEATIQLRYRIDRRQWLLVSEPCKDLIRQTLSYAENRISASDALKHSWLRKLQPGARHARDSVLKSDATVYFPGPMAREQSRAIIMPSNALGSMPPVHANQEATKFWVDAALQRAIATLMTTGDFYGRFLATQNGYMLLEEYSFPDSIPVAEFIAKKEPYTELECRTIFRQLVLRVLSLHEAGVAHRNLHPQNIVIEEGIGPDGFILNIRGFQYAQLATEEYSITGRVGRSRNKYDWFVFVSPEIDTDFVHDMRVDLWSLGALLYMFLCGVQPFTGTGKEIRRKKLESRVEFAVFSPSPEAQLLVEDLLQCDPERRICLEEIWTHPWMRESDEVLSQNSLDLARMMFGDWNKRLRDF